MAFIHGGVRSPNAACHTRQKGWPNGRYCKDHLASIFWVIRVLAWLRYRHSVALLVWHAVRSAINPTLQRGCCFTQHSRNLGACRILSHVGPRCRQGFARMATPFHASYSVFKCSSLRAVTPLSVANRARMSAAIAPVGALREAGVEPARRYPFSSFRQRRSCMRATQGTSCVYHSATLAGASMARGVRHSSSPTVPVQPRIRGPAIGVC